VALNLKFNSFVLAPEVAGLKQVYFVLRASRSELVAGRHYANNLVLGAFVLELRTKVRQFYPFSTELVEVLRSHESALLLGERNERLGVGELLVDVVTDNQNGKVTHDLFDRALPGWC